MNPAIFDKPFFEVTLPLMLTIVSAVWAMISTNNRRLDDSNHRLDDINRRFDDMNRRFDEVITRLGRIEELLSDHSQRIVRLEERISPFARH